MKYALALLLSLAGRAAGACECLAQTLQQAYQAADCVVQVRVVALRDTLHYDLYSQPVRPPFRAGSQPVLQVRKVVKGHLPGHELTLTLPDAQSMCNFTFRLGATYVVFLHATAGGYTTSTCQPNFLATEAAARRALRAVRR